MHAGTEALRRDDLLVAAVGGGREALPDDEDAVVEFLGERPDAATDRVEQTDVRAA